MIELRTLGALELDSDGTSLVSVLTQPRRAALLCYLALESRHGFRRRDLLYAMFWPEHDAAQARHALRQSLYFLRRAMGAEVIASRGDDELTLAAHTVRCDAREFEEAFDRGAFQEALALYRGDLLPGFHIANAPDFDRWLDAERVHLRRMAARAASSLAEAHERDGDLPGASGWWKRAVVLSPGDETALRRLVLLLGRVGDRAAAVSAYEAFALDLERAYELEPSEETRALIARIRAGGVPVVNSSDDVIPGSGPTDAQSESASAPERVLAAGHTVDTPNAVSKKAGRVRGRRWYDRIPGGARTAAGAALLLLTVGGATILATDRGPIEPARIIVLPFENLTGDPALEPVGRIAADWILQGLARTEVVQVVPGPFVSEQLRKIQQGERESPATDASTRTQTVARALGAGTAVVGSFQRSGDSLDFQVQVVDVDRRRLVRAIDGIRGWRSDPMSAIGELRRKTIGAVAFRFDARLPSQWYGDVRAPTYEAYQAFAVGEDLRNRGDWRQALPYFNKAYALDTTFTTALFLAVIQHNNLRQFAESDSLIRILSRSRERLSPIDRQLLEWVEAGIRGDLPASADASRGMIRFSDGYKGQASVDALHANRPREAVSDWSAEALRLQDQETPFWQGAYWARMTEAYHRLGDYRRELASATQSTARLPGAIDPVLFEMRALIALGRVQEARKRLDVALALLPAPGRTQGEILLRAADEFRVHEHADDSQELLLRALAWHRALPDSEAKLLRNRRYRAATLLRADSLQAAERAFRELAADSPNDSYYIASVAVSLARQGKRQAAVDIVATALQGASPFDYGHNTYERARVAAQLGDADAAIDLLNKAFAQGFRFAFVGGIGGTAQPPDGRPHLDPAFDGLRQRVGFQELARGKD